jgi:hypothetical protein
MSAVAGWFRWRTTPDRIRGIAAVTVIAAVVLGLITAVAFASIASGLRLIGQQAEPEVLATTDLYFRLNDMDAQVANVLLVGRQRGLGIDRQQAQAIYEQDRQQADLDLLHAAVVARSEPPVRALLDGLGRYEALAGEAMYLDSQGPGQPGRPPAAALVLYRQATDLLSSGILPAARALTNQNTVALDRAYQAKRSTAQYGARWVALAGVALLAALASMQFYERDDRHIRTLNRGGNLRGAIAFDTSYAPGNSNWAFTQYDNALVALIAINQRAFTGAIRAGQQDMTGWTWLIPGAAVVLISILVIAGVRPRLAEYRYG